MKNEAKFWHRPVMILCIALSAVLARAQQPPGSSFNGYGDCMPPGFQYPALTGNGTACGPNGRVYTPKGRLHVLVVLMRDPATGQPGHPSASEWNPNDPNLNAVFAPGAGPGVQNILFNELPSTVGPNQQFQNLSQYFYDFSDPADPFIVTGIIYPEVIPVTLPSGGNLSSSTSAAAHKAAIDYIASQESPAWWNQFDLRTGQTSSFAVDNSTSGPDGVIDYIVFMQGNTSGNGLAGTLIGNYAIPGTNKVAGPGHSFQASPVDFPHFAGGFLHEYSHVNMAGPHYSGANNTHGTTFNVQNFYGMMCGESYGFFSPTAWESWFNGWLIPSNFVEVHPGGLGSTTYELKDFSTEHAAMRIQLPVYPGANTTPQYLWLENRKLQSHWDRKQLWNLPVVMDTMSSGIYAYIIKEAGSDLCQFSNGFATDANLLKPLSADGAYDWEYSGHTMTAIWGMDLLVSNKLEQNPMSGGTYRTGFAMDIGTPGTVAQHTIPDGILHLSRFSGNSNTKPYDFYNQTAENVTNQDVEHWKYTGNAREAFQIGGEISLSGAIPAVTYPNYNDNSNIYNGGANETWQPTYINGLSVKYVGNNSAGNALVQVRYDDFDVRSNKRWCGNLILPDLDVNSSMEHLNIAAGVELRIDQSKNPNRETIHPVSGTWVTPTTLSIQNGGAMHLDPMASVVVENNSELILESGAGLEVHDGAKVIVRTNGKLLLKGGSKIYVHDGGSIIIERGAKLEYEQGADIVLNGLNSVLEIHGNLVIGPGANFTFRNGTSQDAGFIRFNPPSIANGAPNISCGVGSSITLVGAGITDLVAEVYDYAAVYPSFDLANLTLKNGLIKMGKSASINTSASDFQLHTLKVTAFNPTILHDGIYVNGQANHLIDGVEISYGNRAMTARQFYGAGATLKVSNSNFHHCDQALVVHSKGALLANCTFDHNTFGYVHYYPTFNSRAFACDFNDNSMRGVHVFTAGARLLLNHSNMKNNGRDGVYFKGNGSLALTCSNASYNGQVGIFTGNASYLVMDNSVNPNGAQSTVLKNPTSISLNFARDIYLNLGRNELKSLVHSTQKDVRGRLMKNCPSATDSRPKALKNHWNERLSGCVNDAASVQSDFAIVGNGNCAYPLFDNMPVCPPVACDESQIPGGETESSMQTPLWNCPTCESIQTTSFPNVFLNKAINSAITSMEMVNAYGNDLQAIKMFHEILTFNYVSLDNSEEWLLDLAYLKLWETYSNACESGKIIIKEAENLSLPNEYTAKVLQAIAAMKARATLPQSIQSYEIDRANAYAYVNRLGTAISILDGLLPQVDAELLEYAGLMRCELAAIEQVNKGILPIWEFESAIRLCNLSMKTANLQEVTEPLVVDPGALSISTFPNPSFGKFSLAIRNASVGEAVVKLFDFSGKEILRKQVAILEGQSDVSIEFELLTLPSGLYTIRVLDSVGSMSAGALMIAH